MQNSRDAMWNTWTKGFIEIGQPYSPEYRDSVKSVVKQTLKKEDSIMLNC